MWTDIICAVLALIFILASWAAIFVYTVYRVKYFAIKKAAEWVYNVAPRYIDKVPGENYYKMSTDGLRAFENYMDTLKLPEEKLTK